MSKGCLLPVVVLSMMLGSGAVACPGDKAVKDKTAGSEPNMSKPSAKFDKAVKPGKELSTESDGAEKATKPKA